MLKNLPFFKRNRPEVVSTESALTKDPTPRIEFFKGISEVLSNVSLQKDPRTDIKSVAMTFEQLNALEGFQSFTNGFNGAISLIDEEGDIAVTPSSCRILFSGGDGDDLRSVVCRFEIENPDHWDRFMRFMQRYAEANGFVYGETAASTVGHSE